ncbi:hypothetical protein [Nonomuraea sp. NPDC048916]|uniref:hypothetical protein n=1 Tax=Nonomuraea sp. NPDC048916 TaxID=3154232 RepID=UPI0033EFA9B9
MGLGDAMEVFGPLLTMIGSVAMLGRQILSGRPGAPVPAQLPRRPVEGNGASIMMIVHVHLPCEGRKCQPGEPPR